MLAGAFSRYSCLPLAILAGQVLVHDSFEANASLDVLSVATVTGHELLRRRDEERAVNIHGTIKIIKILQHVNEKPRARESPGCGSSCPRQLDPSCSVARATCTSFGASELLHTTP